MKKSLGIFFSNTIKSLVLLGSGWKRRKRGRDRFYRIEWQDPASGNWYDEKPALRLVKAQALSEYDKNRRYREF